MDEQDNIWRGVRLTPNRPQSMDVTRATFAVLRSSSDARWRNVPADVGSIDSLRALDLRRETR
jgi:hypothetical protein